MADIPAENEKAKRPNGVNQIERMKLALQMSERDPNMRGIAEGLNPVVEVLDGHEGRLNDHDALFEQHDGRFKQHEDSMEMLAKIAQDYLHRRIDKRDRKKLFGKWRQTYDALDDAGRKNMDGIGKFLRDKFLEARKLGAPEAAQFEGMDDDDAVSAAVLNQLRAIDKAQASPVEVFKAMASQMGYKPEEIQAAIVSDTTPGKESLTEQSGDKGVNAAALAKESEGAHAAMDERERMIDKGEKAERPRDNGKNPDAAAVRERAKMAPENRSGGQNVMSADDLLKIKRKYGKDSRQFLEALQANAAAKHGF